MDIRSNSTSKPQEDFMLIRVFNAPCALVFESWTRPEQLKQWWGGKDLVRDELVPNERIVFTYAIEHDEQDHKAQVTVTFAEQDGKTTLTMNQLLMGESAANANTQGDWLDALDKLEEHLDKAKTI